MIRQRKYKKMIWRNDRKHYDEVLKIFVNLQAKFSRNVYKIFDLKEK